MGERVLITGGSGFIGSWVAATLARSHEVISYDVSTPSAVSPFASHVLGDVQDVPTLAAALDGCSAIFHFAAYLGVVACQADETRAFEMNICGAEAVAKAVEQCPSVRRIVGTSSSEVYGEGTGRLLAEDEVPHPRSAYGRAKVEVERTLGRLVVPGDRSVTLIRPFNVYGPRQRLEFVVARYCADALLGRDLVVHGSGQQTRTFTYIGDIVTGIVSAFADQLHELGRHAIYNMGSYETVSIRTLANVVNHLAGSRSRVVTLPFAHPDVGRTPDQEVHRRVPSLVRASSVLRYQPAFNLYDGIFRTLEWHRTLAESRHTVQPWPPESEGAEPAWQ